MHRRLAAILAADVAGYSRLIEADEVWTLATLKERRKTIIEPLVEEHNRDPKPFVWTADPDRIVEKVRRACHALAAMG